MSELTVFVAAFFGSFTGMILGLLPVLYYVKKKISKSPVGAMF